MLGSERAGEVSPWLSLPGAGPRSRPERTDLDEVIALHERMLRELPADHPQHAQLRASYLALSMDRLPDRASPENKARLGELMDQLPSLMQGLISVMQARFASRAEVESHAALGTATPSFEALAEVNDAIARHRLQLAVAAPDDQADVSTSLAHALFTRYLITSEDRLYREAVDAVRRTVTAERLPDPTLVFFWGLAAHLRDPTAESTIEPAPGSELPAPGIGVAALRIVDGDPRAALVSWERHRAAILSAELTTNNELDRLRATDPRLAERFATVLTHLRAVSPSSDPVATRRREALTGEWNALLEQAHARQGFERLLVPSRLTFTDLAPAGEHGPVIAVNVDRLRCDALVLHGGEVRAVALPALRAAELVEQASAFRSAIEMLVHPVHESSRLYGTAGQVVVDTLAWLWDVLAEPVLAAAGLLQHPGGGAPWPRVWWSPTGPLAFLPLHAAGRHREPGVSVLDRAVSSYTSTLRALRHSRARPRSTGQRRAVAVAMPDTPGHPPLPATAREANEFAGALAGTDLLVGASATREAVRAALPGAATVHFACHASSDPANAEMSHLLLHDGPLSVVELSRLSLVGAELAYLSACATARGSAVLADEAVHLASAFQLAGYAQAIGTLWEVDDERAASTAGQIHRLLASATEPSDRPEAALALHTVTRLGRAQHPDEPWLWAGYVHAGA
jgi:hypothetical protein